MRSNSRQGSSGPWDDDERAGEDNELDVKALESEDDDEQDEHASSSSSSSSEDKTNTNRNGKRSGSNQLGADKRRGLS